MTAATLTAALLVLAAPAAAPDAGDLARLQGRWTACAGPKGKIPVTLEIRGQSASVRFKTPQGLAVRAEGSIRIDPSASPKALDWVEFTGADGQDFPTVLAIYELDGDALRVCNGGFSDARPSAFRPGEGPLAAVLVFRRPADEPRAEAPRSPAVAPAGGPR